MIFGFKELAKTLGDGPERIVIAKPVASRPTSSNFRSLSELASDSTNGSGSSEHSIIAIRPKTVRFKPVLNSPPVELSGTQSCHLSDTNCTSTLIYKPLAKTVSRTTIGLQANMGTINASSEQVVAQNLHDLTPMTTRNDKRRQLNTNNNDRPSYDGYNWRKYGQKQVKGSEYPRSYYKCTHPNCPVKKKVERSIDGEIAEIVYKGEHNHSKPRLPRRHVFDGIGENFNRQSPNNQTNDDNEVFVGSSSSLNNLVNLQESYSLVKTETAENEPASKKRKSLTQLNETFGEGIQEPQVVVHDGIDPEAISDGFRWRKYGQKVVKGNPYPRSYYRCTGVKCNVRKHVERASDDQGVFITTYEGKHNHEMPIKKGN